MDPRKRQATLALFIAIILLPTVIFLFRAGDKPYLLTLLLIASAGYAIVTGWKLRR